MPRPGISYRIGYLRDGHLGLLKFGGSRPAYLPQSLLLVGFPIRTDYVLPVERPVHVEQS